MIQFIIKTLDSKNHIFTVTDECSVAELKEYVTIRLNLQKNRQKLLFRGKVLRDDAMLKDLGVNGEDVHLVETPPPGRDNRPMLIPRMLSFGPGNRTRWQMRHINPSNSDTIFGTGAMSSQDVASGTEALPRTDTACGIDTACDTDQFSDIDEENSSDEACAINVPAASSPNTNNTTNSTTSVARDTPIDNNSSNQSGMNNRQPRSQRQGHNKRVSSVYVFRAPVEGETRRDSRGNIWTTAIRISVETALNRAQNNEEPLTNDLRSNPSQEPIDRQDVQGQQPNSEHGITSDSTQHDSIVNDGASSSGQQQQQQQQRSADGPGGKNRSDQGNAEE